MLRFLKYVSLIISAICVLFPPIVLLMTAFKSSQEYVESSPYALPKSFLYFDNFKAVLETGHLGVAFFNIFYIAILAITGNVFLGTMVAYALGRFRFKGRTLLLALYSLAAIIPSVTTQVATYSIIKNLGLTNTHYSLVLLYMSTDIIQIYIYLQFIKNIPYELDESAFVEGASLVRIYRSIVFPLLAPATATIIVLKTISIYNEVYLPYLYMPSDNLLVVTTSLLRFSGTINASWNELSAAIIIVIIPTVLIYLFMQRYIYSGIVSGAIK